MAQEIRVDRNCFSLFGKEPHLWRLYCDEKSKRLRGTDEGNGSLCLPATISVVAFWLSAGFATARMLQGCYMVQRQGVCGSRFDSDDVQTCGIIVLLLVARCSSTVVDSDGDGADSYLYCTPACHLLLLVLPDHSLL